MRDVPMRVCNGNPAPPLSVNLQDTIDQVQRGLGPLTGKPAISLPQQLTVYLDRSRHSSLCQLELQLQIVQFVHALFIETDC